MKMTFITNIRKTDFSSAVITIPSNYYKHMGLKNKDTVKITIEPMEKEEK